MADKILNRVEEMYALFTSGEVRTKEAMAPKEPRKSASRRGGKRRPFVVPAIERLVAEKWLVEKTVPEITEKLREATPGATDKNVQTAILRLVKDQRVVRRKDDTGVWRYSIPKL